MSYSPAVAMAPAIDFTIRPEVLDLVFREVRLPVTDAAVGVKNSQDLFLLKRMLADLRFINLDSQSRFCIGPDDSSLPLDEESFAYDLAPPGHIVVNRFADDVAR